MRTLPRSASEILRRRFLAILATTSVVGAGVPACGGIADGSTSGTTSGGSSSSSSSGATSGGSTSGTTAPATCSGGRRERQCQGGNAGIVRRGSDYGPRNPDAAPPPPPPPPVIDALTGCMVAEEVMTGCCNPAISGPELVGGVCCWDFCEGSCCGRPVRVLGVPIVAAL